MGRPLSFLRGLGLGAGLMYFLDPDRGRRRRALARDQALKTWHRAEDFVASAAHDLGQRAHGFAAEFGRMLGDHAPAEDHVLVARVRSRLGRHVAHARAIRVEARDGQITLHGPIDASEVAALLDAVASVPGVRAVDSRLDVRDPAAGRRDRPGRSAVGPDTWSPGLKLLAGVGGGVLAVRLLGRSALPILGLGLMGATVLNQEAGRAADYRPTGGRPGAGRPPRPAAEARSQADPFHVDPTDVYAPETGP